MQVLPTERVLRILRTRGRWLLVVMCLVVLLDEVHSLNGPNVCMVKQKYNITKRVKYRAPMSVRTYEWCFAMPPRCSRWTTEMRDLTRLETEERTAEVAVCCPGYKMKDITCIPICPSGKTGSTCSEECPSNKWGPNCINNCKNCSNNGTCSSTTGQCICREGWKGESCQRRMYTANINLLTEDSLTTAMSTSTRAMTSPVITTTRSTELLTTTLAPTHKILTTPFTSTTKVPFTSSTNMATETSIHHGTSRNNLTYPTTEKTYQKVTESASVNNKFDTTNNSSNVSSFVAIKSIPIKSSVQLTTIETKPVLTTPATTTIKISTIVESTSEKEYLNNSEITKTVQAFNKDKPKEIWIKPAQKGDTSIIDPKIKITNETIYSRNKYVTKKPFTSINTTPKTIIVSIIPTSIAYSTFKKISLTTATYHQTKKDFADSHKSKNNYYTNPTIWTTKINTNYQASTIKPNFTLKLLTSDTVKSLKHATSSSAHPSFSTNTKSNQNNAAKVNIASLTTIDPTIPIHINNHFTTNSMKSVINKEINYISHSTLSTEYLHPTNNLSLRNIQNSSMVTIDTPLTTYKRMNNLMTTTSKENFKSSIPPPDTKHFVIGNISVERNKYQEVHEIFSTRSSSVKLLASTTTMENLNTNKKANITKVTSINISKDATNTITSTERTVSNEDENFHILTEPEHITAVIGNKDRERTSVDLISVLSIAGGAMMAVITVAVIIVMIERCKKTRYEQVHKVNNIRMQVVMENADVPPPYVRSIFHTPLPEPPMSEKCHYQPLSTLDRNLKQFMRPVVVQAISPVMLENFRGILECHYDHLPRRSNDFESPQRHSIAPSLGSVAEPRQLRVTSTDYSVSESTIEALKCEAKFNVIDSIDSTTSEPLYAEIPNWRPPSEHAIEIVNLNGEAVTEL